MNKILILALLSSWSSCAFAFAPASRSTLSCTTSVEPTTSSAKNNKSANTHSLIQSTRWVTALQSSLAPISPESLSDLDKQGYIILKDWLPKDLTQELRDDINHLRSKQKFNIAKIGQDSTNSLNTDIRIAETCFLGESKLQDVPSQARNKLYTILDDLRANLSGNEILDECDTSTGELVKAAPALDKSLSELLYGYYPTGGFYRRHTDSVVGSASVLRSYSLLLYLNNEWKESDGGYLRVHLDSGKDFLPDGEKPNFVDVEPKGGTLVLFKSDKIPHEVLDTQSERMAVIGWYNRPLTTADMNLLASEGDKKQTLMLAASAALVTLGAGMIIMG